MGPNLQPVKCGRRHFCKTRIQVNNNNNNLKMAANNQPFSDSDEFDYDDHHHLPGQQPRPPPRRTDRIRRSFHQTTQDNSFDYLAGRQQQQPETIQVTLNEGYFAAERRQLVNCLANVRQKISSVQMFNPAKNDQAIKRQEEWTEKVSMIVWACGPGGAAWLAGWLPSECPPRLIQTAIRLLCPLQPPSMRFISLGRTSNHRRPWRGCPLCRIVIIIYSYVASLD